jgi:hypothetical protein
MRFDSSSPQPITKGLPPDYGAWRRLWREPEGNGPPKGARAFVNRTEWTRQGPDGFLGHARGQGQTSGLEARRQGALILRGGWCGAHTAGTARKQTGMRLRRQVGESVLGGTPRKKLVKRGVREKYGLLTGAF